MNVPFEKMLHDYIYNKKEKPYLINIILNVFDKMKPETLFFTGEYNRLPLVFYYLGGLIWNIGWVSLFTYLVYTSFTNGKTSSFVSLEKNVGICSEVLYSITGQYNLDNYGYWENDELYLSSHALMSLDMKSYTASTQNYSYTMNSFAERYKNISKKSMYRDLAYNLNVLASASILDTSFGRTVFEPTGEIAFMLNKDHSFIGTSIYKLLYIN